MVRHLKVVVLKEIKELIRDPRILVGVIIIPLVIFPLMGQLFSIATEATLREMRVIPVALIDEDRSEFSYMLLEMLRRVPNIVLVSLSSQNWIEEALNNSVKAVIKVSQGFASDLSNGLRGNIEVYLVIKSLGMGEVGVGSTVDEILGSFSKMVSTAMISKHAPNANAPTILEPIIVSDKTIVKGEVVDVSPKGFISALLSQTMVIPIVTMLLMIMAAQIAVTSIAVEKEEKTLETLLTLPVKRVTILWGKLIGSTIVAAISVIAYMVGFNYYMSIVLSQQQMPAISTSYIGIPFEGYAVLAISLFLSLMSMLALAILLGAYAQDVRSAQSLIGILFIPILVPTFILMYADPLSLPLSLQIILYLIPFSHPIIAVKSIIFGNYLISMFGLLYNMAFMVVVLYVAARFFSSEKVVTARITLGQRGTKTS
ncbi:MAG: ABC transporter permease [Candidatus Nezhaarchaeales archaeon]